MRQVEHVAEMQVGDFIQLPPGEWHKNTAAQAIYAEAQQRMRDAQGTDAAPQYQVDNEPGPGHKARLVRIRLHTFKAGQSARNPEPSMARPSKLTDAQWEQIGKRLLANESAAALAREFGVSKASISARFSKRVENVKSVANQIVATENALALLNVSEQIAARSLADELKAISQHLAGAARLGAMTAHRLAGIAQSKVLEVDDAAPLDDKSRTALSDIAVLTKMANGSAEIGLNLLKANKDAIDAMNKDDAPENMNWTINLVEAKPNAG